MKSAVLNAFESDLTIEEREVPEPGRGEVLIQVEACGVCHSDLHLQEGDFPMANLPVVPGHEVVGRVTDRGPGVDAPEDGAYVGMPWRYTSCGRCDLCLSGREIMCSECRVTGVTDDGGYQEYMVAPADDATPVPESLDPEHAAPLMCAGITTFNGLRNGEVSPSDQVAVVGLGGLGHLGVQYASRMARRVAVLSTSPGKEDFARSLGADTFINLQDEHPGEALQAWNGGADLILSTAPSSEVNSAAVEGLAPDGRLVLLGVTVDSLEVNPMLLIEGRRKILGSPSGGRSDLRDTLRFSADHRILPEVRTYPLEDVQKVVSQLREGSIQGRAVLCP